MSEVPSPPTEEVPHPSRARASLIPAVLVAALGIAPVGLAAPWGGLVAVHDLNGIGGLVVVFWLLFLLAVVYAWSTKSDERASIAIFIIWTIALLNLGGCAAEWVAVDKALG